ncbi:MAG: laccase domain-containing protein [Rhodospirillales bacterium]|nr:laccase domain-containing protein [Alphaproteobacteria bacterium]MCB9986151.1 laccase domain-containing protein [Rhodospirillales bacterium]USO07291.1 MAG: laccase domain-containing protein [Rhodospirillales bacterium]
MLTRRIDEHPDSPPCAVSGLFNGLGVVHGFFGRRGGVSRDGFESLNAGWTQGDNPVNISDNRALIARAMGLEPDRLYSLKQVHGNRCWTVNGGRWALDDRPEGDAMVTATPGVGLGALSADCAPVLFAAPGVIGAAHAGRVGALKGVLESTIVAMQDLGADRADIRAVIGPCIGPESYELGAGEQDAFLAEDPASADYFHASGKPGHVMFDLPGYCAFRLRRARIGHIEWIGHDTLAAEDMYFSHRRSTLRQEKDRGLQLSVIALKQA